MNLHTMRHALCQITTILALGAITAAAHAQTYHVSLNTSSLASGYSGPLYLDFQFFDGGDPSNNTATVSGFDFGTGGSAPANDFGAVTTGTAFGGLSSGTVSLADDSFFNELYQPFTPGDALQFDVNLSTNLEPSSGSSPDSFVFSILDGNQTPLPTDDPSTADALVSIDVSSATPPAAAFATLPDANNVSVTPAVSTAPVPEFSSAASLAISLLAFAFMTLRARRRA